MIIGLLLGYMLTKILLADRLGVRSAAFIFQGPGFYEKFDTLVPGGPPVALSFRSKGRQGCQGQSNGVI